MDDLVITSSAVISPVPGGLGGLWSAMSAGRTFFGHLGTPPGPSWPLAELNEADLAWPDGRNWADSQKYANGAARLAVTVAGAALANDPAAATCDPRRGGVVVAAGGSGNVELDEVIPKIAVLAQEPDAPPLAKLLYLEVPDYSYIRGIPVQIGQFVSMLSGYQGANAAVNGEAGVGGLGALSVADGLLRSGELDRVLVVGVAPRLAAGSMAGLDRDERLGTDAVNGRGPFDVDRTGTLLGQGAAAILVERADAARRRAAPVLGYLLGCETLGAADRCTALGAATERVLAQSSSAVDFWWAHGAGSPAMDQDECTAVAPAIGAVPVTSTKGTIGNAFECSALIDLALALESFDHDGLPPVGLLRTVDPALGDIKPVVGDPLPIPAARTALVTAFTHGGGTAVAGTALLAREER